MTDTKAIIALALAAVVVFAGIGILAEAASAEGEGENTSQEGAGTSAESTETPAAGENGSDATKDEEEQSDSENAKGSDDTGTKTVKTYKVAYTYNGQTYNAIANEGSTALKFIDVFGAAALPEGYDFEKWTDAKNNEVSTISADVTLSPVFVPASGYADIELTYGKIAKTYHGEAPYSLTAADVADFAEVAGIAIALDDKGLIVSTDSHYKITAPTEKVIAESGVVPVTLKLSDPVYSINYIVDGTTYTGGTNVSPNTPVPVKEGYTLIGWNDGTQTIALKDMGTYIAALKDDVVLKAVWEPAIWTVVFNGFDEPFVETVKNGDKAVEPAKTPVKEGYRFTAWSANGTDAYDFGSAVTSDVSLSPLFAEIPATVTYVVDGITVYDPAEPAKYGYDFVGWNDGTTVVKTADLAAYVAALAPGTSVTLTAVWTPVYYDVTFVTGETSEVRSAAYGNVIDEPALAEGYKAWIDGTGAKVSFPYTVTAEATITAVPYDVYTATFKAGDDVVATVPVREGTAVAELPELPAGYSGWDYDGAAVVTDITVSAIPVVYRTVTFDYGVTYLADRGLVRVTVEDGTAVPEADIPEIYSILGDVRWTYKGEAVTADITVTLEAIPTYTVEFVAGDETVDKQTVLEGQSAVAPELPEGYSTWGYDGSAVYADAVYKAVPVEEPVYTVTFQIEGKAPVVQMSDSLSLPDTARSGFEFQGWVVSGSSTYIDPLTYTYTQDTVVTAVYKAVPVEEPDEAFLDTVAGQIAVVIVVLAVIVIAALLVAPASPVNYKALKAKKAEKKEAAKKP